MVSLIVFSLDLIKVVVYYVETITKAFRQKSDVSGCTVVSDEQSLLELWL